MPNKNSNVPELFSLTTDDATWQHCRACKGGLHSTLLCQQRDAMIVDFSVLFFPPLHLRNSSSNSNSSSSSRSKNSIIGVLILFHRWKAKINTAQEEMRFSSFRNRKSWRRNSFARGPKEDLSSSSFLLFLSKTGGECRA